MRGRLLLWLLLRPSAAGEGVREEGEGDGELL